MLWKDGDKIQPHFLCGTRAIFPGPEMAEKTQRCGDSACGPSLDPGFFHSSMWRSGFWYGYMWKKTHVHLIFTSFHSWCSWMFIPPTMVHYGALGFDPSHTILVGSEQHSQLVGYHNCKIWIERVAWLYIPQTKHQHQHYQHQPTSTNINQHRQHHQPTGCLETSSSPWSAGTCPAGLLPVNAVAVPGIWGALLCHAAGGHWRSVQVGKPELWFKKVQAIYGLFATIKLIDGWSMDDRWTIPGW